MAIEEVPLDEKAKRTRDLLSSFYSPDLSMASSSSPKLPSLDAINSPSFDSDLYMNLLVQKTNLEGLLQKHVEVAAEIKNLDTDLQMLVYENYNKFISATDTIKRMKNNIGGMESNMEQLLQKIMSVQSKSDRVNTSLFEKREHIEKLHRTRNLLRKVQFIYDLPTQLGKCIKSEAYADAVRFFTGAAPIFKAYGESSFQDCKKASEEAMGIIINNLQAKLYSDSEPVAAKAEAVVLLKQLDYPGEKYLTGGPLSLSFKLSAMIPGYFYMPKISVSDWNVVKKIYGSRGPFQCPRFPKVDTLKINLLEKLKHVLSELQIESRAVEATASISDETSKTGTHSDSVPSVPSVASGNQASIGYFSESVHAYRIIFPDSEGQLIELARDLFTKHFETIQEHIKKRIHFADLYAMLRVIWTDMAAIDEVLPEAALPTYILEATRDAIKQYVSSSFSHLLLDVSDALKRIQNKSKDGSAGESTLQIALESSKKTVIQGSMDLLLDFRQLLDDNLQLLARLKDLIIDWVQEGFQEFFRALHDHFILLPGRNTSTNQDLMDGQGEKVPAGLVLVLAQLSIFIEQSAIPRITEEIAASFSGGGVRGYEYGPAFVPGEICRIFRAASEKFLHLYIAKKTQKISILLNKRFTAPNWIKHKEPREVHMFVDIFLQELEAIRTEVIQILPHGVVRKHHRSESTGSTTSSRSNPMRDDKMTRSNTQRGRSQLLESHLAKLFKQKMEIFTKVEHTQESVVSTIVKLCLKSLQEFVRLQTFNRSGFQQIQLDIQFLRNPLKEIVEDEAAIDFLMDEVIVAAAERCLDPIPLEPAILDKLIQAKLAKSREQKTNPQKLERDDQTLC